MQPMTMAQKILAAHADRPAVQVGELIDVRADMVLANDITAPLAIIEFAKLGVDRVFDQDRIALVPDHFAPNKDIKSAEQCKMMREFARQYGIRNYFEVWRMGIRACAAARAGAWCLPGDVGGGRMTHTPAPMAPWAPLPLAWAPPTSPWPWPRPAPGMRVPATTRFIYNGHAAAWVAGKTSLILHTIGLIGVEGARYQAMEFVGPAIDALSMDGRLTMANMAIEAGAKAGLFHVDATTEAYVRPRAQRAYRAYASDPDAAYERTIEIDASQIEPQVSFPHLPSNARGLSQVGDVRIDQAVIGSCTNGRWSDLVQTAEVLRGRQVHPDVRCIIIPGTQAIYLRACKRLAQVFVERARCSHAHCGPCLGGYMRVAAGERCISTTNRNFVGRMGHVDSQVYLAGPAIAAASAVLGRIGGPEEL